MADKTVLISQQFSKSIKILKWKVSQGISLSIGRVILLYDFEGATKLEQRKLKSTQAGTVHRLLAQEGAIVKTGESLLELTPCIHPTVMKDMCAECGADLRKDDSVVTASVPMVHSIPELKVSQETAQKLGKADGERLLKDRKLVLLVDLDQTLIHTTNDNIPPNITDIYHFQLYGHNSPWYHTRLRPGTHQFLSNISLFYELHICTFGARNYAHTITMFLDSDQRFFSNRILSRDECFDPTSKKANLKALFPCGDNMVCIIDDREDVWSYATNLIHVKPYHFFQHTGDINAPPGLDKHENDCLAGVDLTKVKVKSKSAKANGKNDVQCSNEKKTQVFENVKDMNKSNIISTNGEVCKNNADSSELCEKEENVEEVEINENKSERNDQENYNFMKINEAIKNNKGKESTSKTDEKEESKIANTEINKTEILREHKFENIHNSRESIIKSKETNTTEEISEATNAEETAEVTKAEKTAEATKAEKTADTAKTEETAEAEKANNSIEKLKCEQAEETTGESNGNEIEVEDSDDYLLYLEDILKKIHREFYNRYDKMLSEQVPDLKVVIPLVRGQVLTGCNLVFSGLVATHLKLEESKAYQVAKSLGAKVTQDLEEDTTHLVAVRPGTAKVNAGRRRKNIKIVTPDWLWACAERWEHVEENVFPLNSQGSKNRHPPPHCSSPEHVPNYPVHETPASRKRTPSGRFMDTIHPLLSFSQVELDNMDKEVDDTVGTDSESEEDAQIKPAISKPEQSREEKDSSSSDESLTGEYPKGFKRSRRELEDENQEDPDSSVDEFPSIKFRRGEKLDNDDLDIEDQDSNSAGSDEAPDEVDDGEWNMMGAALEREFLSNN